MNESSNGGPVILGATGLIGQALARVWPKSAPSGFWQCRAGTPANVIARFPGLSLKWDILATPAPKLWQNASCMIVLAGVRGNNAAKLSDNSAIALAAVKAARIAGIPRVLVASSQAVYGNYASLVSETNPCHPTSAYGRSKLEMEQAMAVYPEVTCLRLGNVAGTDTLFQTAARQSVTLDRFTDGSCPRRSYIGPATLADVLLRLSESALRLPRVLNVGCPGVLAMDDLLREAGVEFDYRTAPAGAVSQLELDVSKLLEIAPLAPANAHQLIAEARRAGWHPIARNTKL
ncbi:hypothetical protein MXMO3_03737 (plasmid) [Maritalea myrionectae]|uniref:NAD-dependent epimerase/dehydratase domain-containing protein n=2 Tax=Maritalea myrionectae TaxID=454601 RepID=A0A2R4MJU6_9HYPH|nr:hypothetical protein MXMO3_03737 [Maritalea myrionectae]